MSAAAPAVVVAAERVALGYGRRAVLDDVRLEVRAGEFWCFLGPNGAGKTTLVRAILGLVRPRAGRLVLAPELGGRERIGFVPQRCELNPALPMTVRELVLLGTVGTGAGRRERAERLAWALAKVGLAGFERRDVGSLSGGQRQRALVARALVRRPRLLVLDEPTNGLDLDTEDALLRFLAALNREEGTTLLVVTHDLAIAGRYASHCVLVHGGRALAGPRDEVVTAANLARAYGVPMEVAPDPEGGLAVRVVPRSARP